MDPSRTRPYQVVLLFISWALCVVYSEHFFLLARLVLYGDVMSLVYILTGIGSMILFTSGWAATQYCYDTSDLRRREPYAAFAIGMAYLSCGCAFTCLIIVYEALVILPVVLMAELSVLSSLGIVYARGPHNGSNSYILMTSISFAIVGFLVNLQCIGGPFLDFVAVNYRSFHNISICDEGNWRHTANYVYFRDGSFLHPPSAVDRTRRECLRAMEELRFVLKPIYKCDRDADVCTDTPCAWAVADIDRVDQESCGVNTDGSFCGQIVDADALLTRSQRLRAAECGSSLPILSILGPSDVKIRSQHWVFAAACIVFGVWPLPILFWIFISCSNVHSRLNSRRLILAYDPLLGDALE